MPGGFTDIKLVSKGFRMVGIPWNSTLPLYIAHVTHPNTDERPLSRVIAIKYMALWNIHQSTYTFQLFEDYFKFIPKIEQIELRGKHQTTFELESEEEE